MEPERDYVPLLDVPGTYRCECVLGHPESDYVCWVVLDGPHKWRLIRSYSFDPADGHRYRQPRWGRGEIRDVQIAA